MNCGPGQPRRARSLVVVVVALLSASTAVPANADAPFVRGDVNDSGRVEITDPVRFLSHTFAGEPATLACERSADADDNGRLNITDAIYTLQFLFSGGPAIPAPFPSCGLDPTADELTCDASTSCPTGGSTEFIARLESVTVMPLGEDLLASIDGFVLADFDALNLTFDAAAAELRGRPLPLSGKWLEIGGRRYMTDRDGLVTVPERPPAGTRISIYWQLADEIPVAEIDDLDFVSANEEAPISTVSLLYEYPESMNGDGDAGAGGIAGGGVDALGCPLEEIPDGCPGTNRVACCEDYLGPLGNRESYDLGRIRRVGPRACEALAVQNFYGSECFQWTFNKRGKPCLNEAAFRSGRPGCWRNHKYRNCQNMDENDLSIALRTAPGEAVELGTEVALVGRNNTASNATLLRIDPPDAGTIVAPPGSRYRVYFSSVANGWIVDQWNDLDEQHFEDFELIFRTPEAHPDGRCIADYTISAQADGLEQSVTLRTHVAGTWRGVATRTSVLDAGDEDTTIDSSARATIDSWDVATGELRGTLVLDWTRTDTQPDGDRCTLRGEDTLPLAEGPEYSLEINYEANPPTYLARTRPTSRTVELTSTCGAGFPFFIGAFWIDSGFSPRPLGEDGCRIQGTHQRRDNFGMLHDYEWDLEFVPSAR